MTERHYLPATSLAGSNNRCLVKCMMLWNSKKFDHKEIKNIKTFRKCLKKYHFMANEMLVNKLYYRSGMVNSNMVNSKFHLI